jgi:hypothetical protein
LHFLAKKIAEILKVWCQITKFKKVESYACTLTPGFRKYFLNDKISADSVVKYFNFLGTMAEIVVMNRYD